MVRLTSPLKGFVLAGALLVGCLPGVAQAKWIKATVNGIYTGGMPDGISLNDAITLNFIIQNYSGTPASGGAPNYWDQYQVKPNYTQLFGYGTGTSSTGLNGFYNASQNPGGSAGETAGNLIESQNDGKEFLMRVSGTPTGLSFTRGGTSKNVINMSLTGNLVDFSSSIPISGSTDVVDFLSASLGTKTCSTTPAIGSPTNIACTGQIQATAESPITFTWSNITFAEIDAVPGPLPVAGALVAFRYSRKIRSRIKG
jgi:hypothetical protein